MDYGKRRDELKQAVELLSKSTGSYLMSSSYLAPSTLQRLVDRAAYANSMENETLGHFVGSMMNMPVVGDLTRLVTETITSRSANGYDLGRPLTTLEQAQRLQALSSLAFGSMLSLIPGSFGSSIAKGDLKFVAPAARGVVPSLDPAHLRTLELHGFKPVDVLPGNNGKVAIIGRPMGGETIGKAGRPLGVHDYADALRKQGYEVEVYIPGLGGDLKRLKIAEMQKKGIPTTDAAVDAYRLSDDVVRTTKSFENNMNWARKMKDEGWTVIDLGNNTGSGSLGAFYEGELGILFPHRLK